MKKKLIASCRVRPYTSGAAIDRQNFGSAVLGLKVGAATGSPTAATLKLALTGCKRFVKITGTVSFTGGTTPAATATYALALGDPAQEPVE